MDFLMTAVVPPASANTELAAAIYPFDFKTFYCTPAFERTISLDDFTNGNASANVPGSAWHKAA